ncbi:Ig-like domain-containing protein [Paenibacillus pasadenensis]|uniref:Ig domain protein group 2 domain protein n=1 Tax=Paenibacillus pasadenensis TaxID=217090 RepID=A0A2N5NDQ8_9BACL|nr:MULTISPECIES: Ig-like domain-containing protein [Paenibacillus]PLT48400.1 Ig domain protein group 2 domain protein [Paenibacillus pasadenensis]QGG58124.1 hypothetical protein GE073_22795 [Paenibacillus sp. B01]
MTRHATPRGRTLLSLLLAAVLALSLLAPAAHAEDAVTSVSLDAGSSLSLTYGEDPFALVLWASYSGSSAKKDVTSSAVWTTSLSSVVKVSGGVLTPVASGKATITGKFGGYSASVAVTVEYPYSKLQLQRGGENAPSKLEAAVGDKLQLDVLGVKNGLTTELTEDADWTSSSAAVATVKDGEIEILSAGTTTIKASYRGVSASLTLTAESPYKAIELSETSLVELETGGSPARLSATAQPKDGGASLDVTSKAVWSSSAPTVVKAEKDGVLTPVGPGTATISVSLHGVTATVQAVVRQPYEVLKLSPSAELHLLLSDSPVQLSASIPSASGSAEDVTALAAWTSSDLYAATADGGLVTPKAAGSSTIKAEYKGVSRSLKVTVYPTAVRIKAAEEKLSAIVEETRELPSITAAGLDDAEFSVTKLVKWTSSDSDIVEIKDGKWIARKSGSAVLKAELGDMSVELPFEVNAKPLALLSETKNLSLVIGKTVGLPKLTITYTTGEEEDVTAKAVWKASGSSLLVLEDSMRGLASAKTTLTASYLGKTVSFPVTIEEEIVKLTVDPSSLTLNPNRSKTVKVTGTYKSGSTVSLAAKMDWSTDASAVASVQRGTIKALKLGSAKLTGTYQGKSVTVSLSVKPKLKSLVLSEKSLKLAPGASAQLKLKAFYDNGTYEEVTAASLWSSSRESSAAVTQGGTVSAVAKGTATIKAVFDGKSVTARVTVK